MSGVDRGAVAELTGQLVQVDVVEPGAGVGLGELVGQVVEVRQILEYAGSVAQAQPLLPVEALGTAPVLTGPERLEVGVHPSQGLHQLRRTERLGGELHQLLALLGGHRVEHPLGGGGALGEGVEQLVDVLRVLGEVVPVLVHELPKVLVGVGTALVLLEQLVEVVEHLVDPLTVLIGGVLERLLHAREPLIQQLPAEQVLDLLVVLTSRPRGPVVVAELADRGGRAGWPRRWRCGVELELTERPVGVVHHRVPSQLLALLEDRAVQQLTHLLQGAVEVVPLEQLAAPLGHPPGQLVEAGLARATAAQELPHRPLGAVPRHHVLADRVQRLGDVHRRRQRVPSVVPAEAGALAAHDAPSEYVLNPPAAPAA